jgi:hypothetical protein
LEEVVRIRPVVPYRRSLQLMTDYDALLLVDAPLIRARESVFLPSKLVDYLGSGTPIIALTPLRGSSARVVTTTGGLVCDVADDAEIERLFRPMQQKLRNTTFDRSRVSLQRTWGFLTALSLRGRSK